MQQDKELNLRFNNFFYFFEQANISIYQKHTLMIIKSYS